MSDFNVVLNAAGSFPGEGGKPSKEIIEALVEMERRLRLVTREMETELGRKVVNGGQIIEARAKEIITEKGHIVTGALRRSINTQPRLAKGIIQALVGSPMEYAPDIEDLPDGGYLNEAAEQRFDVVTDFLAKEAVNPSLKFWGEA